MLSLLNLATFRHNHDRIRYFIIVFSDIIKKNLLNKVSLLLAEI